MREGSLCRPMVLNRVLRAETLKMKRTIALKMVVLAPLAVVLLTIFMASQAPFSTLRRNAASDDWKALARVNFQFWGLLMMPLFVTLQTALMAGLDHTDNQWKALLARPVPRWTFYVSKLLIVMAMTAASAMLLVAGVVAAGGILHLLTSEVRFGGAVPLSSILLQAAQMTGLAFFYLSIQTWVALRWRSFSAATGVGIVATVTSFAMLLAAGQFGAWPQYYPWALPMLVLARQPENVAAALSISAALGMLAAVAGCADFCRREVT
ncbi:ABC transporter permease [Paludibaculum fermentans]|uniref:ABC transporter permease n=1 Tax=Paludibaculum fermentans TaxID=1473598 RepID=UPI003EBEA492